MNSDGGCRGLYPLRGVWGHSPHNNPPGVGYDKTPDCRANAKQGEAAASHEHRSMTPYPAAGRTKMLRQGIFTLPERSAALFNTPFRSEHRLTGLPEHSAALLNTRKSPFSFFCREVRPAPFCEAAYAHGTSGRPFPCAACP